MAITLSGIPLGKHMVIPKMVRKRLAEYWEGNIKRLYCGDCGFSCGSLHPMTRNLDDYSFYCVVGIDACDDRHEEKVFFFRIISSDDADEECYQLGFCGCGHSAYNYDYKKLSETFPKCNFWENCYLMNDGDLMVPATDGSNFMLRIRLCNDGSSVCEKYYNKDYETVITVKNHDDPALITKDDNGDNFAFSVREIKDGRVALSKQYNSLMIKCRDKWLAYSKTHSALYTVEEGAVSDCNLYVVPTFDVEEGDLIYDSNDGEYYFMTSTDYGAVRGRNVYTYVSCVPVFDDHRISPECKILGISIYYKVLAATDAVVNTNGNISGMPGTETMLDDATMAKIFMLSSMMENSGKPGLKNLLVPLAFTTGKNADIAARTVMLYAMLNGMYSSE